MVMRTRSPWAVIPFAVAALIVLVLGGYITFWNGDASEKMFVTRIAWSAMLVVIATAFGTVTCIAALWRPGAMKAVFVTTLLAALFAWGTRAGIVTDAAEVNSYRAVEGGPGGLSSPITRAMSKPFTSVDPRPLETAWGVGTALLLIGAALAGWSMWRLRRAERRA